jgi:hypothetical protein
MSFFPPVFQTLKTSETVKAIVGTNPPRIYRHGAAPQDVTRPYITWQLVAGVPENHLSGLPQIDRQTVQVDCWHPVDSGVEQLALAVRDVIEPVAHMTIAPIDSRDVETRLFRVTLQFDFFAPRT